MHLTIASPSAASAVNRGRPGSGLTSVRWTAAGNILRTLLATLQLLIIARLVSVAEFGLVVLVTSIVMLTQMISDAGLSSVLIRFRDANDDEKSSLYWLNAAFGVVMACATLALAPVLAVAFKAPALQPMLQIVSVIFVAQGLYLQLRVLAERDLRFGDVIKVETAAATFGFAVSVTLALMQYGPLSVVWGQVAGAIIQLGLSQVILTSEWRPRLHFRWADVTRFMSYGLDMLLVNLATSLTVQVDVIIAGLFFPKQVFGSFSQPRDLSLKVMNAVNPVVTRVGLPLMARYQHDPQRAGIIYLRIIRMSASVCFPIYAMMALSAGDLIPALLGRKWAEAGMLMPWIAPWFAIRCIVNPLGSYMYAMGRSRSALWYQIAFAIAVTTGAYLGAKAGPVGISLVMAGVYLLFSEICWFLVLRPISGVSFLAYHCQIYLPATCTLLAVGSVLVSRQVLPETLIMSGIAYIIGVGVFFSASLLVNRAGVREISGLIGRSRPVMG
jgi:O-antigen/teichoic acid export membrane protein